MKPKPKPKTRKPRKSDAMKPMPEGIIEQVIAKRLKRGLSIRRLGSLIGCSFSTLARLERGTGEPAPHTRERLQKWLDSDEGSAPRVRNPAEESWFAKMERRIAFLEARMDVWAESREGGQP